MNTLKRYLQMVLCQSDWKYLKEKNTLESVATVEWLEYVHERRALYDAYKDEIWGLISGLPSFDDPRMERRCSHPLEPRRYHNEREFLDALLKEAVLVIAFDMHFKEEETK